MVRSVFYAAGSFPVLVRRMARWGVCPAVLAVGLGVLLPLGLASEAYAVRASRPNIVLILADDLGWADPGFNGGDPELTPSIDRLADQGTRFTQFYVAAVCAPTRAALLTGRYPFRTWMDWRSEDFGKPDFLERLGIELAHLPDGTPTRRIHALDSEERTVAEALQEAGYFTAIFGKWHLGEWLPEHLPMGQGFDHQYGHYGWGIDYNDYTIPHNAPQWLKDHVRAIRATQPQHWPPGKTPWPGVPAKDGTITYTGDGR